MAMRARGPPLMCGGAEPARGLEPLTARLQGGCHVPHLASTSDYSHAAARIDRRQPGG